MRNLLRMETGAIEQVLPFGTEVVLERLSICAELVTAEMSARGDPPRCSDCSTRAKRVHSRYWRTLAERPLIGRRLSIRLRVRRFFCDRRQCPRLTFVEQVRGLSERHRRSGLGLKLWLQAIAAELGGRPGERLCQRINLRAGSTQLLGLLEAPDAPERSPRVLGVDEFAFRKGKTYGTLLVDVETSRVVDVLPDRTSETFANWLRTHPGVEIVCRDRAIAYTKAIKEAAPHATEVADRWHMLQNLAAAVEKTCHQHRACLRKHIEQREPVEPPAIDLPPPQLPRASIVERTRDRYADVHRLLDEKWTISAIARQLGLDRKTVRHFRETSLDELLARACDRSPSGVLDPFKPYLNSRFVAGCTTSRQLFNEIRARGYQGAYSTITPYLAKLRAGTAARPSRDPKPSPHYLVDHASSGDAHRTGGGEPARRQARLPRQRPSLRSGPMFPRPPRQPPRRPAAGVDPPGRAERPRPGPLIRRLPSSGPRRRPRRPHPRMELWKSRRQRESSQDTQEGHVWPGFLPAPSHPYPLQQPLK
ncbi:ISL3 family transposase [Streptacidiphilus sp. NEAU-YB345]|uniref:ISL3 family transposase n=1 Tax=Streptacidiphilus fuscans TaxID=2789292 RepID=A0A931FD19_9ACTN|nr:ISL3 family transposase [Streptacidiphilus fuscans]MBF9069093.1 ISL3 family transposase [Streptacidiphilus fuscans]